MYPSYNFSISSADMFANPEELLSSRGPVWHGVAIGWRKDAGLNFQALESTNERIVGVKLSMSGRSLILISLYAPTSGHDEDFLATISNLSDYLRTNCSQDDQVLIGADTNCSNKSSPRRQRAWAVFCQENSLVTHSPPFPTFHHHNGLSSTSIDAFVATSSLTLGNTRQYCTLDTPTNLSSHDPIMTSVAIAPETSSQNSKFSDTYTDFKRSKIAWDPSKLQEYQTLTDKALTDAVTYWDSPEFIPLLSTLLSNLLVKCASLAYDSTTAKIKRTAKKPPWRIRQARSTLNKCFKAWKKAGRPCNKEDPIRQRYAEARSNLQRLTRYENNLANIKQ